MFCKYCGNKIDDDSTFCENCGAKVERVPLNENSTATIDLSKNPKAKNAIKTGPVL